MLPCVGCVGVVFGGRCWHSPFLLAMACCDSRPGFCCLKSPSVVYWPSFRHPPLGHKLEASAIRLEAMAIQLEAMAIMLEAMAASLEASLLGWRPSLVGWRPLPLGWRPLL